jgi:signal recognition particle GTPase
MKQAVTRTRDIALETRISSVVALTREVDDASLDDLELALLASDIGVATTTRSSPACATALCVRASATAPSSSSCSRPNSSAF